MQAAPDPTPHTLRRMLKQGRTAELNATTVARPVTGKKSAKTPHYAIGASRLDTNPINARSRLPQVGRARRKEEDAKARESMRLMLARPRSPKQRQPRPPEY